MNIAGGFIRRPVMTTLVMGAILIFGVISYRGLPVSDLPNVDFPTLQVSANLPGASPQTMAAAVATPLERQFLGPDLRVFLLTGCLGGFTTFSAFAFESLGLALDAAWWRLLANVGAQLVLGLGAAVAGYVLGRAV